MEDKVGRIIMRFCWVPLLLGIIGYYTVGGLPFFEALYDAGALYFVNPASEINNVWVMASKLSALIVAAGVVLSFLTSVYRTIDRWFMHFFSDSTAVYTDNEVGEKLQEKLKHGFYGRMESMRVEKARYHIIFLDDDTKSLQFYEERRKLFGKNIICLLVRNMDPFLLNAVNRRNIRIINIYEVMARKFWRRFHLFDVRNIKDYSISIIGYENIGRAIFRYGYLNNIFALDQKITYHIWGCNESDAVFLNSLNTMNNDRIVVHKKQWQDDLDEIAKADRVIITQEEYSMLITQEVMYRNSAASIFYFNEEGRKWGGFYAGDNLQYFGDLDEYLTEDDIKEERLYRLGKLFNYDYNLRYGGKPEDSFNEAEVDAQWDELPGFKRASSMARGDHYWIEKRIREDGTFSEEEFWEIEHVRWSRYHFINHWTYAPERDNANRKHNLLVPFEDLPLSEKEKDGIYGSVTHKLIDELIEEENREL
ncbi:MAG: hypothetical protein K6G43_10095 [Lachnospiraceae bacterium]|nr:hypothetical protein [Lachnospiraceae bacterium]